jgi:hypothetical protein
VDSGEVHIDETACERGISTMEKVPNEWMPDLVAVACAVFGDEIIAAFTVALLPDRCGRRQMVAQWGLARQSPLCASDRRDDAPPILPPPAAAAPAPAAEDQETRPPQGGRRFGPGPRPLQRLPEPRGAREGVGGGGGDR